MENKKWLSAVLPGILCLSILISGCGRIQESKLPAGSDASIGESEKGETSDIKTEPKAEKNKARTVITTDGEVDDMNSVIRFLLYSNEMDLSGIVLTSSMYHYAGDKELGIDALRWTGTKWLDEMLDAYEEIYPNLSKHAEGYPDPQFIRSVTKIGNISNKGEMDKETDGSKFLESLFLDDDPRDLYVQTWGGTNTTARALKSIEEQYKATNQWEEIRKKVSDKLVLYIILDQDESYKEYIAKSWPDIRIINDQSNFWHFAYAWKYHTDEVNSRLQGEWNYKNILTGHGKLLEMYALMGDGKVIDGELLEEQRGSEEYLKNNPQYNRYDFVSEGDSPSFFYLIDNGLRSMENPSYGGWGGRFGAVNDKLYHNNVLDFDPFTHRYEAEYSLMRWFDDIQDDFAARADWAVAEKYEDANHNPSLTIKEGLDLTAKPGDKITLTAEGDDPDGDFLTYRWWRYFEADTYREEKGKLPEAEPEMAGDMQLGLHRDLAEAEKTDTILLDGKDTQTLRFTVPGDARTGDTIHIIAEVQDNGEHNLKRYQRVIITVE